MTQETNWTSQSVIAELRALGTEENRAGMARFGIDASNALGVPMSILRPLSRRIGKSPELAQELWKCGYHEARLLAILLTPPKAMTADRASNWLEDIHSWDLCDQLTNILARREDSDQLVFVYADDEREFVKRAAFALIAWRAVHAKSAPDSEFLAYMELIKNAATDERNFVWKAVHWALRQIGKRSRDLHGAALAVAEDLQSAEDRTARRVGREAVRELSSEKVRARLGVA
ncbi:MAG: DNA alkylation repair protein [Pseudomonadota bacterium]